MMGIIGNFNNKEEAVVEVVEEEVEEEVVVPVVVVVVVPVAVAVVVGEHLHKHSVQLQNHFQSHRTRPRKLQEAAGPACQLRRRLVSLYNQLLLDQYRNHRPLQPTDRALPPRLQLAAPPKPLFARRPTSQQRTRHLRTSALLTRMFSPPSTVCSQSLGLPARTISRDRTFSGRRCDWPSTTQGKST